MTAITLERVKQQAISLSLSEQIELIETLASSVRKKNEFREKEYDWTELYGLGSGLWVGEDAQEYVNHIREDRL